MRSPTKIKGYNFVLKYLLGNQNARLRVLNGNITTMRGGEVQKQNQQV